MWTEKANKAILIEIGARCKEYRIRKNLQQRELAVNAGTSLDTISRFEKGGSISTLKLIAILRALDMLENLEGLIPEPPISPILLRKLQGVKKKRIRK
ncbi:helix-turn-helix domain-containing protein [Bacteroides pyogenes]|jgi:transcriptional regulator with XRE-family HTH domain|uniref:Helix-turn-helix transcriptional regulator n=1 Tax=Bacteroides pyogenes TaxID=310300 RepID=A0A5D3EAI7_9BACE|nr:helix-turn-helix transcriptional regulator [Bacteroides pyogenes]TYK32808.1 helix-turn-helix transcriptional regulator [Bacteroides pyogenes]